MIDALRASLESCCMIPHKDLNTGALCAANFCFQRRWIRWFFPLAAVESDIGSVQRSLNFFPAIDTDTRIDTATLVRWSLSRTIW